MTTDAVGRPKGSAASRGAFESPLPVPDLVLCDFDGTLTRQDSWLAFLFFVDGRFQLLLAVLKALPRIAALCLRSDRISGPAKALILRHLWNGYTRDELEAQAVRYTEVIIPTILRRRLYQQLQAWKKEGAQVAIVSASLDVWLAPFCAQEGFTLISTRSVWGAQGQWTGFEGLNCNGAEKARRIREVFDLQEFKRIYAHGNTKGDLPMLQLAHTAWMWKGNTAKKVF